MQEITVEQFGDNINAQVLRLKTRKFPGVLIQGDSLKIIGLNLKELDEALGEGDTDGARAICGGIERTVASLLAVYESELKRQGMTLPY